MGTAPFVGLGVCFPQSPVDHGQADLDTSTVVVARRPSALTRTFSPSVPRTCCSRGREHRRQQVPALLMLRDLEPVVNPLPAEELSLQLMHCMHPKQDPPSGGAAATRSCLGNTLQHYRAQVGEVHAQTGPAPGANGPARGPRKCTGGKWPSKGPLEVDACG